MKMELAHMVKEIKLALKKQEIEHAFKVKKWSSLKDQDKKLAIACCEMCHRRRRRSSTV